MMRISLYVGKGQMELRFSSSSDVNSYFWEMAVYSSFMIWKWARLHSIKAWLNFLNWDVLQIKKGLFSIRPGNFSNEITPRYRSRFTDSSAIEEVIWNSSSPFFQANSMHQWLKSRHPRTQFPDVALRLM